MSSIQRCVECRSVFPATDLRCPSCNAAGPFLPVTSEQVSPSSPSGGIPTAGTAPLGTLPTSEENPTAAIQRQGSTTSAVSFAGEKKLIWLIAIGLVSLAALVTSLIEGFRVAIVIPVGAVACVFGLPLVLIVIAAILSVIVQIFAPGGARAIPLFKWKGGVDGLSDELRSDFENKPPLVRISKVYLWLAVNSLVGGAITLIAFAGLYVFMQFVQQQNH